MSISGGVQLAGGGGAEQQQQQHACFVCLSSKGKLMEPCACTWLRAHRRCIARWCLQSAGKDEESRCRFCHGQLPDWRDAFALPAAVTGQVSATMSIQSGGMVHWVQVKPGAVGMDEFREDVRRLLRLGADEAFDITFECRLPGDDTVVELQGLHTYDAAVFCATLSAAERASQASTQQADATLTSAGRRRRGGASTYSSSRGKSGHADTDSAAGARGDDAPRGRGNDSDDNVEDLWNDVTSGVPLFDIGSSRMGWLVRAILVPVVRLLDLLPLR